MKRIHAILIALILLAASALPVLAQDAEFMLRLRRDFGYGSGSDVRGNFTLSIIGSEAAIKTVTFQMDGKEMTKVTQAPFKFSFATSSYPDGWHQFTALVETVDGRTVTTQVVSANFLSAQQQSNDFRRIFIPLIGVIILISVLSIVGQTMLVRGNRTLAPGSARQYGLKGGAICKRCGRPFAIHTMSMNLIGGYYDRCDYCGKWQFARPRSRQELEAAERAELEAARAAESAPIASSEESEEERLRKMLDESRYNTP